MKHNYDFWNNKLPKGFYDDIFRQGKSNNASLQSSWHNLTFLKIKDYVDESFKKRRSASYIDSCHETRFI